MEKEKPHNKPFAKLYISGFAILMSTKAKILSNDCYGILSAECGIFRKTVTGISIS